MTISLAAMSPAQRLEAIANMAGQTMISRLGIEITALDENTSTGTMPVAGNTQPLGLLHGGASIALAETLGSLCAMVHADALDKNAVGIEVTASHHRSARSGIVTGVATALHLGRSLATYEITVHDADQRLLCTSRVTCMLIDRK